jgi:hypothetical protein
MTASFAAAFAFLILHKNGIVLGVHQELLLGVGFTTVCWILTAFVGPETDHATLMSFYKLVHPIGPGWTKIREEAGVDKAVAKEFARQDNIPMAMLGWVSGTAVIWSGLFVVGNVLYGRTGYAMALLAVFVITGSTLIWVIRKLWT